MSKIKVNEIEAQTGSTITIPTGQSLVVTDGLATSSLPTVPVTKGGTGLTSLGTANQVVAVNSGASALEFQDASSGGIVQLKSTTKLDGFGTSSSSPVDVTGLSVNITPSSTSNKVLVMCNANLSADAQSGGLLYLKIVRVIGGTTTQLNESNSTDTYVHAHAEIEANTSYGYVGSIPLNFQIIDSPSTTSQCTYKLQAWTNGSNTAIVGRSGRSPGNTSDIQHATQILAMEIDGGIL
jgi:hypothetical protein